MIETDETFGCVLTAAALIDVRLGSQKSKIQIFDHVQIFLAAFL